MNECLASRDLPGPDLPFNRRFSPRNPTSPSGLLRTRLTMTASFSRPWNPSTLPSSMPGYSSLSGERIASWMMDRCRVFVSQLSLLFHMHVFHLLCLGCCSSCTPSLSLQRRPSLAPDGMNAPPPQY